MFGAPQVGVALHLEASTKVLASAKDTMHRENTPCTGKRPHPPGQTPHPPGKHPIHRENTPCTGQTPHAPDKHPLHRANTPCTGQTPPAPGKHTLHRANTPCTGKTPHAPGKHPMHRADMLLPQSMAVWLMTAYRHDSIMTAFFKYNDHGEKRRTLTICGCWCV